MLRLSSVKYLNKKNENYKNLPESKSAEDPSPEMIVKTRVTAFISDIKMKSHVDCEPHSKTKMSFTVSKLQSWLFDTF